MIQPRRAVDGDVSVIVCSLSPPVLVSPAFELMTSGGCLDGHTPSRCPSGQGPFVT
jgi:hypothetical protein